MADAYCYHCGTGIMFRDPKKRPPHGRLRVIHVDQDGNAISGWPCWRSRH